MKKIKYLVGIILLCTSCSNVSIGLGTSFPIGNINFGIGASKQIDLKKDEKKEVKNDKKEENKIKTNKIK